MKPILENLTDPKELHTLSFPELTGLAIEIRRRIIDILSQTGGHLASNLGIVELTLALHKVFDTPTDKLIFDVGHQSYVHKLLTGRNGRFPTLRQTNGLSGFTDPEESPYDLFYAGHAGNALSLSLGVAKDRDLNRSQEHVIPILGDAALTCGLTLEAMNNIPKDLKNFIVILNDNAMSISKNVGAITNILSRFFNSPTANNIYQDLIDVITKIPGYGETLAKHGSRVKESLKNLVSTAPFFEQFGLSYVGPIDGHDIKKLVETLEALKNKDHPTLLHVLTVKGQGMQNAINNPTPYHGAKPFDRLTGEFLPSKSSPTTFPKIFGKQMLKLAKAIPNLMAITPAMPTGSCLDEMMKVLPHRCIDVGIAEGHAVTYAGGIGVSRETQVVACIYSSFLQRAFDNIYHDVCIQDSPVIFAIDRAGLATGDGVTAQGIYDIAFLRAMPNIVIAQPRNGDLLKELLESALSWNRTVAIRYPNLKTTETEKPLQKRPLGKAEVLAQGKDIALIALGHMCDVALEVKEQLANHGIDAMVIDPIFVKPLDEELLYEVTREINVLVTIEEHAINGGLGSMINDWSMQKGPGTLNVLNYGIPDQMIPHGDHKYLLERLGLSADKITESLLEKMQIYMTAH